MIIGFFVFVFVAVRLLMFLHSIGIKSDELTNPIIDKIGDGIVKAIEVGKEIKADWDKREK